MSKLIKKVSKKVGSNPVARAVAVQGMRQMTVVVRTRLYLMDEGEDCRDMMVLLTLPANALALAFERLKETDSPDARKLKAGMKLLLEISERQFAWRKDDTVTIDNIMEILERRWPKMPPRLINACIQSLRSA